jgi:hypothetical protein
VKAAGPQAGRLVLLFDVLSQRDAAERVRKIRLGPRSLSAPVAASRVGNSCRRLRETIHHSAVHQGPEPPSLGS